MIVATVGLMFTVICLIAIVRNLQTRIERLERKFAGLPS